MKRALPSAVHAIDLMRSAESFAYVPVEVQEPSNALTDEQREELHQQLVDAGIQK